MGLSTSMFLLQLLLILILYIAITLFSLRKGPRGLIQHYPPEVQTHAVLLAEVTRGFIITKEKLIRPLTLLIYSVAIILFTSFLNEFSGFLPLFLQVLILFEIINWIDALFIEGILLRHCRKILIPGTEELMKGYSYGYFFKRKLIHGLLLVPYALLIAFIASLF